MNVLSYLNDYYNAYDESQRLTSRHGQVEFLRPDMTRLTHHSLDIFRKIGGTSDGTN